MLLETDTNGSWKTCYWPAKAFPLWIEQLGDVVLPEETSYIMPFGPLRRIIPPEWPSITLAVQLEKLGSNVAVICRAPASKGITPTILLPWKLKLPLPDRASFGPKSRPMLLEPFFAMARMKRRPALLT